MKFIPLCLYYVLKYFDAIWIFLHKVFQFANTANLTSSKSCTVFSTWVSHTHFNLYRDVLKYFIYEMLATSDYYFIFSLLTYVQWIVFQRFVHHFCVSVLFRNICISFLSIIDVGHIPSSTNLSFSTLSVEIMLTPYYLSFCEVYLAYLSVFRLSAPVYLQIISVPLRSQAP